MQETSKMRKMYITLFNAVSDAIIKIDKMDFGSAKEILIAAQRKTEDIYIDEEEMQ